MAPAAPISTGTGTIRLHYRHGGKLTVCFGKVKSENLVIGRKGKVSMRRFAVTVVAAAIFVAGAPIMGASVGAAPIVAPGAIRGAADSLNVIERAQFIWLGRNYCWYDDGWNGPGWYWCGQYLVRGVGWGGGYGWHGWRGGHAGGVRGGHGGAAVVRGGHGGRAVVRGGGGGGRGGGGGHGGGGHGGGGHGGGGHGGGGHGKH